MDFKLKDKVVVVTGGALGIGEAITTTLANEGAIPVIVGKDLKDNLSLSDTLIAQGNKCDQFVANLNDPQQCKEVVKAITQKYGNIHGLVNNAGLNDGVGLEHGSYEGFIQSYHANTVHYYLMAHHLLPFLKQSGGSIVNIISKVAETGQGGTSGYAAANGARNGLTREWAVELLPYGIRVNAVIVAECYTHMYKNWLSSLPDPELRKKEIESEIPFGNRMTAPVEIANMAVFLLSNVSSHTTGQLIHVDGGYVHLDRAIKGNL
ncbi:MAG TPA: SDR family oxidoreductase [Saprospiraceae bacterium]|nr:SDR family oxidoreductase [Saprospiraceae bacterium]